ncbi:hypothetical protein F5B17DRAFT_313372 [Nemania serpens]|nr:hypothetical protein F5B17DRAFT_313372 [Nemania serpens]
MIPRTLVLVLASGIFGKNFVTISASMIYVDKGAFPYLSKKPFRFDHTCWAHIMILAPTALPMYPIIRLDIWTRKYVYY